MYTKNDEQIIEKGEPKRCTNEKPEIRKTDRYTVIKKPILKNT